MSLRKRVRQVPGARPTYLALMRAKRALRRAIFGPNKNERYDLDTGQVLERVLRRDDNCIDLGAHTGDILKTMVKYAPDGKHHAVEALPHLAERLRREFPKVTVHSCAVSDRTGEQTFQFVVDDPPFSGLTRRKYRRDDMEVQPIVVPLRRLDDLIPADVAVRVIKADIEGAEYHALQGARQILERSRPYLIFEFGLGGAEYFSVTPAMMYTLLHDEMGYDVSTMTRWLTGQPALSAGEFSESFAKATDEYFLAYPKPVA